jgi:hypothetical protein
MCPAIGVVRAGGIATIQQPAGHIGVMDLAGIDILDFQDTALAAPVTERLPFLDTHLGE